MILCHVDSALVTCFTQERERKSQRLPVTLHSMVRQLVGLRGGGGGWFWGESGVGTWAGLELGVGLNSSGGGGREEIQIE